MHRRAFAAALAATASLPALRRSAAQPATPAAGSPFRAVEVDGTPIALSPDGTRIAGVTEDDAIAIWDAVTFERIAGSLPLRELAILDQRSLAWAPDASAIAFSLESLRLLLDGDIYVFDLAAGEIANLTNEAPDATPAVDLLEASRATPLHVDVFPSWSPDSAQLAFARTTAVSDQDTWSTEVMTIPRDGGEARELATVSSDSPYVVSGPMTWNEDGSILYATWPPQGMEGSGIFLAMPDGTLETVSTGLLAEAMPAPLLANVNTAAGLASVVSSTNLAIGLGDPEADVSFLVDLRTGIPTPIREILPLPAQDGSSPAGYRFVTPPAITIDGDRTLLTYAVVAPDTSEAWQYDMASGEAVHLGTLSPPVADRPSRIYYPSIDIAANGAMFITGWNGNWISTAA